MRGTCRSADRGRGSFDLILLPRADLIVLPIIVLKYGFYIPETMKYTNDSYHSGRFNDAIVNHIFLKALYLPLP